MWEPSNPNPNTPKVPFTLREDYSSDINNDGTEREEKYSNESDELKWPEHKKTLRSQRKFVPVSSDNIVPQSNIASDWKAPTRRQVNSTHELNLGFRKSSHTPNESNPININNNNSGKNNASSEGGVSTSWSSSAIERKNRRRFSLTLSQDIAAVQEEVERALSQQNSQNNILNNEVNSSPRDNSQLKTPPRLSDPEYDEYKRIALSKDFSQFIDLNILQYSGRDSLGRPVVLMLQANMSVKNIDLDQLLLYFIAVLDPIVNNDYVLVFVASGVTKENRPSVAWLKKAYAVFNRKYKKNLKTLYIVHPNIWIKMTLKLFRPFISSKFWKKLSYIDDISEIYRTIDRNQITFPPYVIQYNKKLNTRKPVFGVPLEEVLFIEYSETGVPEVIEKCVAYLRNCYEVEGIFRKSGGAAYIDELKNSFNRGEDVDLSTVDDPHAVSGLFKTFLRDLPDPLLTFELYDAFIQTQQAMANADSNTWIVTIKKLLSTLPPLNQRISKIIFDLLYEFSLHSDVNLMTTANLSIVFAPNILKPREENLLQVMQDTPIVNSLVRKMIEMSGQLWE